MARLLAIIALAVAVAVGLSCLAAWGIATSVLAGVQGPAGPAGPAGPTGPTGPVGPPGAAATSGPPASTGGAGSTGPRGANGADGTNGANGTDGSSDRFYFYGQVHENFSVGGYLHVYTMHNVGPMATSDSNSQILTVVEPGLYAITFDLTSSVDPPGIDATCILLLNGSQLLSLYGPSHSTATYPVTLSAGDTLAIVVQSTDSSTTGYASGSLTLEKVD